MLNINSPTVQMMLQNTPQGFGNMPIYYGNGPTITTEAYTVPQGTVIPEVGQQMPYPSPKEMVAQIGQSNVYTPSQFAPVNVVGAYNPGYQAAFSNYSNPYMGQGSYGGIPQPYNPYQQPSMYQQGYQSLYPQYQQPYNPYQYAYPQNGYYYGYCPIPAPIDKQSAAILECCMISGLNYDDQLKANSEVMKMMSRIAGHNLGRSEEEQQKIEDGYTIKPKFITIDQKVSSYGANGISCEIIKGDKVIYSTIVRSPVPDYSRIYETRRIEQQKKQFEQEQAMILQRNMYLYNNSLMRRLDNMNLAETFTSDVMVEAFSKELNDYDARRIIYSNINSIYNNKDFKSRLVNEVMTPEQMKVVNRFTGRYGVMPDGREVYPSHDPSVATSFSYDPTTGKYNITAPNFIQSRIDKAREQFRMSIDSNEDQ